MWTNVSNVVDNGQSHWANCCTWIAECPTTGEQRWLCRSVSVWENRRVKQGGRQYVGYHPEVSGPQRMVQGARAPQILSECPWRQPFAIYISPWGWRSISTTISYHINLNAEADRWFQVSSDMLGLQTMENSRRFQLPSDMPSLPKRKSQALLTKFAFILQNPYFSSKMLYAMGLCCYLKWIITILVIIKSF